MSENRITVTAERDGQGRAGFRVDADRAAVIEALSPIPTFERMRSRDAWRCFILAEPLPSMWLLQTLYRLHRDDGVPVSLQGDTGRILSRVTHRAPRPHVDADSEGRLIVFSHHADLWDGVLRRCGVSTTAAATSHGAKTPTSAERELIHGFDALPDEFAAIISPKARAVISRPLPAPYDGSDASLRRIPVTALDFVSRDAQAWADRKANGMHVGGKLKAMGLRTLHDLIVNPPFRYVDRSHPQDVRELMAGDKATVVGRITAIEQKSPRLTVITVTDHAGSMLDCSFFNGHRWLSRTYRVGDDVVVNGVYKPYVSSRGEYPQMSHPDIDFLDSSRSAIIPVYRQSGKLGVSSRMIENCESELIDRLGGRFQGPQWMQNALDDADLGDDGRRMPYGRALVTMHQPEDDIAIQSARRSLSFCEMVQMLVIVESSRKHGVASRGVPGTPDGSLTGPWIGALPYELTDSQKHAVDVIGKGQAEPAPMHALLVGDVGSGKTTVIHLAALASLEAGHQAVICAPTEILAQQLYDVFMETLDRLPSPVAERIRPALRVHMHGKGAAAASRAVTKGIADGSINMVFGTHAVFSDDISWHDLGFVGIDEQHKFGADQRTMLLKARGDGLVPDMLMQTATPIPRSIAQVYYGDIHYLRLDHGPKGRLPIRTEWIRRKGRDVLSDRSAPMWADIVSEARQGHGTFIICPMVEEGKADAANVKGTYQIVESMMEGKHVRCGMIYGSQDRDEQARIIEDFRDGRISVLVASSVVEVGVSCDKASRMLILDANRFGLASLHQIRGRIGRSSIPSICWLAAATYTPDSTRRMEAMTGTMDGWSLAKKDLANRGTGTVLGDAQHGSSDFVFADLVRDAGWLDEARREAKRTLAGPDAKQAVADSRKWFGISSNAAILS